MHLADKTVLITGGRRIGATLAVKLAERGADVALSYFQSHDRIEAVADDVRRLGRRAIAVAADLRKPEEAEHLVDETVRQLGALHVLVNMASEFYPTPFDRLPPEEFNRSLDTNLKAPYFAAMAAVNAMRRNPIEDGIQGKIVNLTDWAVERPYRNFLPYLVAKGALATLTRVLAVELAPTIAVNAVAPAMIDPPPNLSEADIEAIRQSSPLKRIGIPEDAVNLVLYLLEGTDFTTGNIFRIDGGRFLGSE